MDCRVYRNTSHVHKVQRQACDEQQNPKPQAPSTDLAEVAKAREPNFEPFALRMSAVHFSPRRRAEDLHTVVTRGQQSSKDVDSEMDAEVDLGDVITVPLVQG